MTLSVRAFGGCVMLSGAFHWNFLGPLVFLNRRAIANQDMCALNNYFYLSEPHFYPDEKVTSSRLTMPSFTGHQGSLMVLMV